MSQATARQPMLGRPRSRSGRGAEHRRRPSPSPWFRTSHEHAEAAITAAELLGRVLKFFATPLAPS